MTDLLAGKALKTRARDRHEIRNSGKISICIGYPGVADIGGKHRDGMVDVGAPQAKSNGRNARVANTVPPRVTLAGAGQSAAILPMTSVI